MKTARGAKTIKKTVNTPKPVKPAQNKPDRRAETFFAIGNTLGALVAIALKHPPTAPAGVEAHLHALEQFYAQLARGQHPQQTLDLVDGFIVGAAHQLGPEDSPPRRPIR